MVDVETVEETDEVLKLEVSEINEAVANSLRRAMMSEVPTLAVKELEVNKNQSGLIDESLANRIGQVPFTIPENVDEDDEVHIALKQEGPGTVLAEDLKADNDEAEPVHPETIIVRLNEDQAVDFEATAVLGTGKEHAKHQGGTVGYEKKDDGEFLFRIESTSGYNNEELFQQAIDTLNNSLDEFEEAVAEI